MTAPTTEATSNESAGGRSGDVPFMAIVGWSCGGAATVDRS